MARCAVDAGQENQLVCEQNIPLATSQTESNARRTVNIPGKQLMDVAGTISMQSEVIGPKEDACRVRPLEVHS